MDKNFNIKINEVLLCKRLKNSIQGLFLKEDIKKDYRNINE